MFPIHNRRHHARLLLTLILALAGSASAQTTDPIQVALSRDLSNNLRATITITNPTASPVAGVTMTFVRASTLDGTAFVDGTPTPQSLGTVNPNQSVAASVAFPGTDGVPEGFTGLVRVDLSYTGGTYTDTKQVVTPTLAGANDDIVRFLEQSTFGPTPALIARVRAIGYEAFLQEQFNAPASSYPTLPLWPATRPIECTGACQRDNYTMYPVQRRFFENALDRRIESDQLRQRVAFALHQILTVSGRDDIIEPSWLTPYLQVLDRNAFGNFRALLEEVTLNTAMGYYLDMRRSTRTSPNENFAREILQLFSIGLFELNQDGTQVLDGMGRPIPTYDQARVNEFSKAFTGWYEPANVSVTISYPPMVPPTTVVVPDYINPMRVWLPETTYHDQGQKTLLRGRVLPPGQTTRRDLTDTLDNIFAHENVGPFISKQLIQHLVTSNPSPAYVGRISAVFNNNGQGVRGDLKAVVRAILLDAEARGDVRSNPNYGKLREPVLLITNLCRAFTATSDGVLAAFGATLQQDVLRPPTVFSYFSPDYVVPGTDTVVPGGLLGPAFEITTTVTSLGRANFVNTLVFTGIAAAPPDRPVGTRLNFSPLEAVADNPQQLVEELNRLLMHGTMSTSMRSSIENAVSAIPTTAGSYRLLRARQALYLVATSSQYNVQR